MTEKIKIIGISGKLNSGKTTLANYIVNEYKYTKYSFADPLKKGLMEIFGFEYDQVYTTKGKETLDKYWNITPRDTMQYFGTTIFRNNINKLIPEMNENFWVNRFKKNYKGEYLVIDDVRFINEINIIKELGGIIIRINRNNELNKSNYHISEIILDNYNEFDLIIENNKNIDFLKKTFNNYLKYKYIK